MITQSIYPTTQNLISYHHSSTGEFPKTTYTVWFQYPDCVRSFDGRDWKVYPTDFTIPESTDGIHGSGEAAVNFNLTQ